MSIQDFCVLNAGQNYHVKGGSDRYQLDLGDMLSEHGHEVIPFAAESPDNIQTKWSEYFPRRVDFVQPTIGDVARYIYSFDAKKKLHKLLDKKHIDVAHLHIYYGQLTASILSVLSNRDIPIVQTLHEYKIVCPVYTATKNSAQCTRCRPGIYGSCLRYRCNRGSLGRSLLSTIESYTSLIFGSHEKISKFICVSDYQKKIVSEMGVPERKLHTIHNFVKLDELEKNITLGDYVLYFGRIEKIKGINTLLQASAKLPNIPLIIVGDGGYRTELEAIIKDKKLKHVRFLGYKSGVELSNLIAKCRFSVVPSEWPETFGLTTLETYVKGHPVIGSRIGGIPEVISDGCDGLLVTPGDVNELATAIKHLWNSPKIVLAMGKSAQLKAINTFGPEQHYSKIINIYRSIVKDGK